MPAADHAGLEANVLRFDDPLQAARSRSVPITTKVNSVKHLVYSHPTMIEAM